MKEFDIYNLKIAIPDHLLTDPIREMIEKGWYEVDEVQALKANLRPDDVLLEVGGGMGVVAAFSARKLGAARVTTVETNPEMIAVIKGNLAGNGYERVDVRHGAVVEGAGEDSIEFFLPNSFWAASTSRTGMGEKARAVRVPTISLSDLIEQTKPSVVMVDAEGEEARFFRFTVPDCLRLIILELHPEKYPRSMVREIFQRLDAQGFVYQPKGSRGAVVCFERMNAAG